MAKSIVVFIDGPLGSGKTKLIEALREDSPEGVAFIDEEYLVQGEDLNADGYASAWAISRILKVLIEIKSGSKLIFVDSSPITSSVYHEGVDLMMCWGIVRTLEPLADVRLWMIKIDSETLLRRIKFRLTDIPTDERDMRIQLNEGSDVFVLEVKARFDSIVFLYDSFLSSQKLFSMGVNLWS